MERVGGDRDLHSFPTRRSSDLNPTGSTITDTQGLGTITNDDAAPVFTIDDVSHNEGNTGTTSYTFTVTKKRATTGANTRHYPTADAAASQPSDYTTASGTLACA